MGDGHDTSCTWNRCAHPESKNPCPFVDEPLAANEMPKVENWPECKHEWRQLNPLAHPDTLPRFFCIHCRKIT